MVHPAAVSSEFQKARAEYGETWLKWKMLRGDRVHKTAATGQGSDSWARNLDCNTLLEAWK